MKTKACPPKMSPARHCEYYISLSTKTREVPLLPKPSIAFPQCEYDVRRSTEPADDKTREQQTPAVGFGKREYSQNTKRGNVPTNIISTNISTNIPTN